jgi:hypothetical protein
VKRFGFVCLFLAGSVLLFGQATATVDGRVVDPAGAAVPVSSIPNSFQVSIQFGGPFTF